MTPRSCIIIGAGLAGLVAARTLAAQGMTVTVLDKGGGVGGRMATRRFETGIFDHGAQYFTVRDPRFAALVQEWLDQRVALEWARGFPTLRPDGSLYAAPSDTHPRYCGSNGMTTIPKYLSRSVNVRTLQTVTQVTLKDSGWQVRTQTGLDVVAEALLITAPLPQTLALLEGIPIDPALYRQLQAIGQSCVPCFALLALLDGPSQIPAPGGAYVIDPDGRASEVIRWVADNRQKGISPQAHAVTLHAGPEFSRAHLEDDSAEVAALLLEAAAPLVKTSVRAYQIQRWRYSLPAQIYPEPCVSVGLAGFPLIVAGDAFYGARIEGAALSGLAAADAIVQAG